MPLVQANQPVNPQQFTVPPGEDVKLPMNGISTADNATFRSLVSPEEKNAKPVVFDGGPHALQYEAFMKEEMNKLNTGAMSKIVGLDIDKEFAFLTELLIEQYKDPDPNKESDHGESTRTIVTLIGAANQAKMAQLMDENNRLIGIQNRMATESRIGKKAQYQDYFFEVRDEDDSIPIYYRLGEDAVEGMITIRNREGQIVQEIPLDQKTKGDHKIEWDRSLKGIDPSLQKAESDIYYIKFEAYNRDEKMVSHIVELEGIISKIDTSESGTPEYYIGGIKVDGRITKISQGTDDIGDVAKHLRSLNPDYFSTKPIIPGNVNGVNPDGIPDAQNIGEVLKENIDKNIAMDV